MNLAASGGGGPIRRRVCHEHLGSADRDFGRRGGRAFCVDPDGALVECQDLARCCERELAHRADVEVPSEPLGLNEHGLECTKGGGTGLAAIGLCREEQAELSI